MKRILYLCVFKTSKDLIMMSSANIYELRRKSIT